MKKKRSFRVIPSTAPIEKAFEQFRRKKVAIYCRVSTASEEQETSIDNQREGLLKLANEYPNWEVIGVYEETKTGTNIKRRKEFQRLLQDCEDGKVDIIVTKSTSRFARNTVDFTTVLRQLNEKGVKVMFNSEEMEYEESKAAAFQIQAAINEEESHAKSQNIKWGLKKRHEQGVYTFNTHNMLGYRKNEEGQLEIVEEQAKTIQRIFNEFLEGKNFYQIAKDLEKDGILTGAGNSKWYPNKIRQILENEKYTGDAHLGKHVTTDFRNKTIRKNKGIATSYYVEGGHPAIIEKKQFDKVQEKLKQ